MLVLERIKVEVIVKKMSVEAFIFDNVVFKKVEVGLVDAEAVVFEELVVDVDEVGVAQLVGVINRPGVAGAVL